MDTAIGRFTAQIERPNAIKFALPMVLVPEMFTTRAHLATLIGYLANSGWEVYAPDFRAVAGRGATPTIGRIDFERSAALVDEAIEALARDVIVMGHGIGGLIALAIAQRPHVRAAIALAPALPGFPTPLLLRPAILFALLGRAALKPPRGKWLREFFADAETFQRPGLIKALVADAGRVVLRRRGGVCELRVLRTRPRA